MGSKPSTFWIQRFGKNPTPTDCTVRPHGEPSREIICTERHEYENAIAWFEKSIRFNPKFANPYYGRAHALVGMGKPEAALASIEELFRKAERQDARSESVFRAARETYWETARIIAKINKEKADKALEGYEEHVADLSGFPVKEERRDLAAP